MSRDAWDAHVRSVSAYAAAEATAVARIPAFPFRVAQLVLGARDRAGATRRLYAGSQYFRAAIALASPSLAQACESDLRAAQPTPRVWASAAKYAIRMADRTTPYGLFTAVAPVRFGSVTDLTIEPASLRLVPRPDMAWTARAIAELDKATPAAARRYAFNDMVVEYGGRLTLLQGLHTTAEAGYDTVSLRNISMVAELRAGLGGRSAQRSEIESMLVAKGFAEERVRTVVEKLVEVGVLLPALRLSPIGDPFARVVALSATVDQDLHGRLAAVSDACGAIAERRGADVDLAALDALRSRIAEAAPVDGLSDLLQVDAFAATRGTLGREIQTELRTSACFALASARRFAQEALVDAFYARYESFERWVPLLEFVDPLGGITLGTGVTPRNERPKLAPLFVRWALNALRAGTLEVDASDDDLARIADASESDAWPDAFELSFEIAAADADAVERRDYTIVPGTIRAVNGAGRTLGRFLAQLPGGVRDELRAIYGAHDDDAVDAELVYKSPRERYENVAIRPRILDVEVQVNVFDDAETIRLGPDDLWIRVEDGEFVVRSRRLGRRIRLHQGHVFEPSGAGPVIEFLIEVTHERRTVLLPPLALSVADDLGFHPRVRHGRTVLVPARWYVRSADLAPDSARATIAALQEHRLLPDSVLLCDEDNKLRVDLRHADAIEMIVAEARKRPEGTLVLEEARDDLAWVGAAGGRGHRAEFVVTYARRGGAAPVARAVPDAAFGDATVFAPGSRWVYVTLVMWRSDDIDRFVRDHVPALMDERMRALVDRWFFVRYAERKRYTMRLRLRACSDAPDVAHALLETVTAFASERVSRRDIIAFDLRSYEPETDRYGGPAGLELAEQIFTLDSEIALGTLREALPPTRLDRIVTAVVTLDDVARGAGAGDIYPWLRGIEKRRLDPRERAAVARIADALVVRRTERPEPHPLVRRFVADRSELTAPLDSIFGAIEHMHFNRFGLAPEDEKLARALARAALLRVAASRT